MILRTKYLLGLIFFFAVLSTQAQQKRALTHADYDGWESVTSDKISANGQWVGFEVNPQDGDGRLEIVSHGNAQKRFVIPRANRMSFSHDNNVIKIVQKAIIKFFIILKISFNKYLKAKRYSNPL